MTRTAVVVAVAAALLASTAAAQRPSPPPAAAAPSPSPSPAAPEAAPDLEISATVRWKELRFDQVGTPRVEFTGSPERETVWHAERENLPTPVQPGVTYRDGGIRLIISSRFRELARILDEAAASPAPSPAASPSPVPPGERR